MDTTATVVLIVLLSVGFIILLGLSITLIIIIIGIMRSMKRITDKAEQATDSLSEFASMMSTKVVGVVLGTAVTTALKRFKRKEK